MVGCHSLRSDCIRFTGKSTILFFLKKLTDCFVARTSHQVPLKKEAHTRTHAAFLRRWAWPNNVLCLVGEEVCAGLLYLVPATYYKWTLMTTTYDMMECYDSFPAVADTNILFHKTQKYQAHSRKAKILRITQLIFPGIPAFQTCPVHNALSFLFL